MSLLWPDTTPRRAEYRTSSDWDWFVNQFTFGGAAYQTSGIPGLYTTYPDNPTERICNDFAGYVVHGMFGNSIVATVELMRHMVFSEARFAFQRFRSGRPADLFSTPGLGVLERPWPGGTTGDLLSRMLICADLAGNAYATKHDGQMVLLRPDWVEIVLAPWSAPGYGRNGGAATVGLRKVGYLYHHGGIDSGVAPVAAYPTSEVAHFAPIPNPLASYVGVSWLTPVITEMLTDDQATRHKQAFFRNAATPNIAVSLKTADPEKFARFVDDMERQHKGVDNAYRTLYTASGADVTVIGSDMKQLDFKEIQGAGETRIINAGGLNAVVVSASEGMQGSSLNAGNYTAARRAVADRTFRPLWRNVAGSMEVIVPAPDGTRLWYDARDVAFLRDDAKDVAEIQAMEAQMIATLVREGFTWESATKAVQSFDWTALEHTGLFSVQLQPPGSGMEG